MKGNARASIRSGFWNGFAGNRSFELVKAFANRGREAPLFSWRDATGHEVDILIDLGSRLVPIEVKAGITVPSDAVDSLRFWTGLPGNPNRGGALIHGGVDRFTLHDFAVRPWTIG